MKKEPEAHKTTTRLRQESQGKYLTLADDKEKRHREKPKCGAAMNYSYKTIRGSEARTRNLRSRRKQPEE